MKLSIIAVVILTVALLNEVGQTKSNLDSMFKTQPTKQVFARETAALKQ